MEILAPADSTTKEKRALDIPPDLATRAFFSAFRFRLGQLISPRISIRLKFG